MDIEADIHTEIKGIHGSASRKSGAQQQLRRFGTPHKSLSQHQTGLYLHCKPLTHFFMDLYPTLDHPWIFMSLQSLGKMMPCSENVILVLAKKKSRKAGETVQDFLGSSKFAGKLLP